MINKVLNKPIEMFFNLILFFRSLFWKRNSKIILFGSWFGEKFADNSRYLYQYLFKNKERLGLEKVIWVTRSEKVYENLLTMGYECYMMDSTESAYYHKHAGIHIVCNHPIDTRDLAGDIDGKHSYGAVCINLWHGIGLKGVGFSSNEYKNKKLKYPFIYGVKEYIANNFADVNKIISGDRAWSANFILSTTNETTEIFQQYFGLKKNNYIESAYPRNCEVPELLNEERKVLDKFQHYKYIVLYLPTFRTGKDKFSFEHFADVLEDTLRNNDILWIQKAHSADTENNVNHHSSQNILNLSPEFDINVLLPFINILVTDYSSVMFDAMYHEKPVLYLVPDFNEYKNGDRGFVISPDEVMQGPIFYNIYELKEALVYYCKNPVEAKHKGYSHVREKYWGTDKKKLNNIWQDIVFYISNVKGE